MKPDIKNIGSKLSGPWLVALIPFFITLVFTNTYFKKYNLKLLLNDSVDQTLCYYNDLDNNGNSEYLQFYTYQNAQILVHDLNKKLEEVYNLPGKWFDGHERIPAFFIGDLENDSLREIFAFTINNNDSLFVSIIRHYPKNEISNNRFIFTLPKSGTEYDYTIIPLGLEDNNGDAFPEFLFVINAGFPLQPRAIFAWDIKNDSVYRSPLMGNAIKTKPESVYFQDVDGDSINEIFVETIATDNYKDSIPIPYTDQHSWVMVFTKNLEFLFDPVQIKGAQTDLYHFPYEMGDSVLIGVEIYNNRPENPHPTFQFYNKNGTLTSQKNLPHFVNGKINRFYKMNNRYYMISGINDGLEISLLNNELDKTVKSMVIHAADYYFYFQDIDADGETEIIVYTFLDETLHVVRGNLIEKTKTKVKYTRHSSLQNISVALKKGAPGHFLLIIDGIAFYLKYNRNPLYILNFILAAFYYLLLVFAFNRLKKVWLSSLQRKQQTEWEMQNLQIQTVLNQLNPHFTFNAMNVVGSAILKGENNKAYESLTKVSRLLRKSVDDAMLPYKTLHDEIEFVKEYLEIEKLRFGEKLEYCFEIGKSVDFKIPVPKMLIHIFVENAIKHGIYRKPENGRIDISISKNGNQTKIIVEDNGIGRQKAKEFSDGRKGKGMLILQNYLRIFKDQYKTEITFDHSDVIKNGEVCGTKAEITISN